jgi:hypothetical protein
MGRVTFQNSEVIRQVNRSFVATCHNVQPGYRVEHLEGSRFEEVRQIPSGQASENVVTLFSTPNGELLHVVPGHWKPKDYQKEIDFALSVARAMARAGADGPARRRAVAEKHHERLGLLDGSWEGGRLSRMVMESVHQRMIREPLRRITEVRGVEDYALGPVTSALAQKVRRLQQLMQQRQREGVDVHPIAELMQSFEPLLQAGKLSEAEAHVDRALAGLGEQAAPANDAQAPPGTALSPADLPESIRRKMERASELAERWKRDGKDLTPVARVMNRVEPLLRQRRFEEAEKVMDRGLLLLSDPEKGHAGKLRGRFSGPPPFPGPANKGETPQSLLAEIERLRPARLVWREIAWNSCLLAGLRAAREQQKPVLLWVFGGEPREGRC